VTPIGKAFRALPIERPMMYTSSGAVDATGRIILAGYRGIRVKAVNPMLSTSKAK